MKTKFICHILGLLFALSFFAGCYALPEREVGEVELPAAVSQEPVGPETGSSSSASSAQNGTDGFTKYADYTPQEANVIPLAAGHNSRILVAYFSRAANTGIPQEAVPDAVTSASLMVSSDGTALGNAQQMAQWIADTTSGDLYAIQTAYTYPVDAEQTVAVGEGQDIDGYLPKLVNPLKNPDQYEYLYLVYPIWHFTLPAPVCSFLMQYSFAGRTIYAFAANAGSRFGDSIAEIESLQPDADVEEGISVSQQATAGSREEVIAKTEGFLQQAAEQNPPQEANMTIQIGENSFGATLADSSAAEEFRAILEKGPVTVEMSDYGSFEKVGPLGTELTTDDIQITTVPGDIMLYNGSNVVLFYGSNTWSYTPLGRVTDVAGWTQALGAGPVTAVFSLTQ